MSNKQKELKERAISLVMKQYDSIVSEADDAFRAMKEKCFPGAAISLHCVKLFAGHLRDKAIEAEEFIYTLEEKYNEAYDENIRLKAKIARLEAKLEKRSKKLFKKR